MSDISKIDKNFQVKTNIEKDGIKFYNAEEKPFKIYGIFKENGKFRRMPESVAKTVSEGVYSLHTNTAGGRVRFVTDSNYIAISAQMDSMSKSPHNPLTNSAGFDLYVGNTFWYTFVPPYDIVDGYESVFGYWANFETREMREITINFPSYSNVSSLYIGLEENAVLEEASPYKNEKPVVFYGSSITQGACPSRAGNNYENILSRKFNLDYINLGFSGNAKGEDEIAHYIKDLDMSIFVYDYDHNAPTVEHLKNTHERMFKIIREKNPDIPIIMMSRPKYTFSGQDAERLAVITQTYENALKAGDKNVYLIDGPTLTALCKDDGTVEGCHPNDFGFASMAMAVSEVFEKILK